MREETLRELVATRVHRPGAVAEADVRDLGKQKLAYGSTGDWLTHLGGLRRGEGRRLVARAHALTGPLAATREAMATGRVSPEQADVLGAEAQDRATAITGQVVQVAGALGVTVAD